MLIVKSIPGPCGLVEVEGLVGLDEPQLTEQNSRLAIAIVRDAIMSYLARWFEQGAFPETRPEAGSLVAVSSEFTEATWDC
jgi:hypothetical protein